MNSDFDIDEKTVEFLEKILQAELESLALSAAVLIDTAGNVIVDLNCSAAVCDASALAALAAANFGALNALAELIGEKTFSVALNKGKNKGILYVGTKSDLLLVIVYGRDISSALLKRKINTVINRINVFMPTTFKE